jgi:hypothetical protein
VSYEAVPTATGRELTVADGRDTLISRVSHFALAATAIATVALYSARANRTTVHSQPGSTEVTDLAMEPANLEMGPRDVTINPCEPCSVGVCDPHHWNSWEKCTSYNGTDHNHCNDGTGIHCRLEDPITQEVLDCPPDKCCYRSFHRTPHGPHYYTLSHDTGCTLDRRICFRVEGVKSNGSNFTVDEFILGPGAQEEQTFTDVMDITVTEINCTQEDGDFNNSTNSSTNSTDNSTEPGKDTNSTDNMSAQDELDFTAEHAASKENQTVKPTAAG